MYNLCFMGRQGFLDYTPAIFHEIKKTYDKDANGVIVLLDERFLQISYRKLFPREWDHYEVVNKDTLERKMERFWDSWGKYES